MSLVQPAEQTPGRTNQDQQQEILAFNHHVIDIALFYTHVQLMATHWGGLEGRERGAFAVDGWTTNADFVS